MTVGEIIFAVMVSIQGLLLFTGATLLVMLLLKKKKDKSGKLEFIALIFLGIAPVFSMIGVFFGFLL